MSFWGELKRRNVFKVGAAYVIVAWLLTQIASTVFQVYQMPAWTVTFVTTILIIGFPVALLFAWAFELTPEGLKKTEHVPLEESITHITGQKLNYILIGVIVLGAAYILFDNLYLDRRIVQTESHKTIAVLPFADLSQDSDQGYFVDGLSEEILNSLAQIPDLTVIARTSSFSFKGTTKKIQEIASELGVDHILEGSVRKAGNDLRITAQLVKGFDGAHLWSKTYDRQLKDIFEVQKDIATTVANELKVKLGIGESLKQLGGTDNEKAYEFYLIAKGYYRTPPMDGALESINTVIELDPGFALAWALKSRIHQGLTVGPESTKMTKDQVTAVLNEGLDAAQMAIELEPKLPDGYTSFGTIKSYTGKWVEAESAFRKAFKLTTDSSSPSEIFAAPHYESVGYLLKAKENLEEQLANDPLNWTYRAWYLQCLGYFDDRKQAEAEYERAKFLFGDNEMALDALDRTITLVRFVIGDAVLTEDILVSGSMADMIKENFDSPKVITENIRRIYSDENILGQGGANLVCLSAYFGDTEFALDAIEKSVRASSFDSVKSIWFPVLHDVRQLPRFKEFVREIGLVDYWNEFGWPDLCQKLDNGDFVCD